MTQSMAIVAAPAAKARRAALPAYWSISGSGRLERSLTSGGPWKDLHVNDSVSFRVVVADGLDVWAGGLAGVLYHSTDGGERWGRVRVGSDQDVVADTIVGINVPDPLHVAVTTDAHETWVTADGGRHWQER